MKLPRDLGASDLEKALRRAFGTLLKRNHARKR